MEAHEQNINLLEQVSGIPETQLLSPVVGNDNENSNPVVFLPPQEQEQKEPEVINSSIWASNYISSHDGNLKIYSTTSSFNSNGNGFTYLFQEKDIVNGLSFELDKGKVGKPKQKGGEHSEMHESQWFPFDN